MGTADRLKQYLEFKGIAIFKAENECGLSSSSLSKALPNAERGIEGKSIGSDNLEKILSTYTDLSSEWLLRGVGSMIRGESKAVKLENKIAQMSKDEKHQEQAYDILLGLFDVIGKTYDFYKEK